MYMEIFTQSEEWKPIANWEGYFVSNYGNIKRRSKEFLNRYFIVKGSILNKGYRYIQMLREGKKENYLVHRCVAHAFLPNHENKPCVDHIDNNRLNNHVNNLRWCTQNDNCKNQKERTPGKKNGVSFDEKLQKWSATIREDNKSKFLGYYLTHEEARLAREKAEDENEFYKKRRLLILVM